MGIKNYEACGRKKTVLSSPRLIIKDNKPLASRKRTHCGCWKVERSAASPLAIHKQCPCEWKETGCCCRRRCCCCCCVARVTGVAAVYVAWPIECASKFMWPFLVVCVESAEANVVVGVAAATSQQQHSSCVPPVSVENCKCKETGCLPDLSCSPFRNS